MAVKIITWLFAMQLPNEQLIELRFLIVRFLMEKINVGVDKSSSESAHKFIFT